MKAFIGQPEIEKCFQVVLENAEQNTISQSSFQFFRNHFPEFANYLFVEEYKEGLDDNENVISTQESDYRIIIIFASLNLMFLALAMFFSSCYYEVLSSIKSRREYTYQECVLA